MDSNSHVHSLPADLLGIDSLFLFIQQLDIALQKTFCFGKELAVKTLNGKQQLCQLHMTECVCGGVGKWVCMCVCVCVSLSM